MVSGVKRWLAAQPRWLVAGGAAAIVLVLMGAVATPLILSRHTGSTGPTEPPGVAGASPSASASSTYSADDVDQLVIDKIGVRAKVEEVGVDSTGRMDIPRVPTDVALYAPGAEPKMVPGVAPGNRGDAVVDGHLNWTGLPHGPFWDLNKLVVGDLIKILYKNGKEVDFKVTHSQTVSYKTDPSKLGMFTTTGSPRLTLVTCTGDFDFRGNVYAERLVVDAALVS
jgi:sortase (surface protein transpeptidase)